MRMHEAKAAKTVCGNARALQVRQFNAPRIAYDDVLNIAFTVNQSANLAARFKR